MKILWRFAFLQFLVCAAFTYNFRSVARADIVNTVCSEILYSLVNFVMVRKIAGSDKSWWAAAGYALGNIGGSVMTILVTRWAWGV